MFQRRRIAAFLSALAIIGSSVLLEANAAALPVIHATSASVDRVLIRGINFGPGVASVWLGGTLLQLSSHTPTSIEAILPSGFGTGSYALTVQIGSKTSNVDESIVTLGAVGPEGPEGDTGAQGPKGDTGAQGASGTPGVSGYSVVNVEAPLPPMALIAPYATCPAGKMAIGGGWYGPKIPGEAILARNEPCGSSWCVIVQSTYNAASYIRVSAVCATVQ